MARKKTGVHLWVEIELEGDGFPTIEELAARNWVIDRVEERKLGHVTGAGGGMGAMDFSVRVADARSAKSAIAALVKEILPGRKFEVRRMADR